MSFSFLDKYRDAGLLLLRIGLGVMFMNHGAPKLLGGPELWTKIGSAMENLGITFLPAFWGFMAGFAEFFGGILLITGFLFRPDCALLTFTMLIATLRHLMGGDGFSKASHAIEDGIVFLSLIFIGPGKHSLDEKLFGRHEEKEK